jgi:hypothetical protein
MTRQRKERSFAMPDAADAIPPNPNRAATRAMIKNAIPQDSCAAPLPEAWGWLVAAVILESECGIVEWRSSLRGLGGAGPLVSV